jgi:Ferritin-like
MLDLALVQNVLSAIGAARHLTRPNLPAPARHYPAGVNLTLVPFGEWALQHFNVLERPEGMALEGAKGGDRPRVGSGGARHDPRAGRGRAWALGGGPLRRVRPGCVAARPTTRSRSSAIAALTVMSGVLRLLGDLITTLPVGPEHPGRNAGPSFELFYEDDDLLAHRESAWTLMKSACGMPRPSAVASPRARPRTSRPRSRRSSAR